MALSGSLNTSGYQGRNVKFSWTATQNTSKNQSTISWTLEGDGTGQSSYYRAGPIKLYIDGVEKYSKTERIDLYDGTVIKTGSFTLTHGSTGKKSFTAKVEAAIYSGSINCTGSKTFTLNDIPRQADITNAVNFNDTGTPEMTYTNPAGTAAELSVALVIDSPGSQYGYITIVPYTAVSATSTKYTFNLTDAQRNIIYNNSANTASVPIRYFLQTKIGSTTLRDEVTRTCTITNANPEITSYSAIDAGTTIPSRSATTFDLTGDQNTFIKWVSTATYEMSAKANKNATIQTTKVACGTQSKTGNQTTATASYSGTLPYVNGNTINFTATDSRGNEVKKTMNIKTVNYVPLTCYFAPTCLTPGGTVNLRVTGKYFPGSFGKVNNFFRLQYRYSVDESATWSAWTEATVAAPTTTDYVVNYTVSGLDYKQVYWFQVRVLDQVATVQSGARRLYSDPIFDWGENDFKFNVPMSAPLINGYSFGEAHVLWSGALYMSEGHTAGFMGGSIARDCHSGIVLIFSRYDKTNGVASNQQFSHHFVPKYFVWQHGGAGSSFDMRTSLDSVAATKYLYISDDKITGHANNIASGTGASGIKYDNSYWVLRYVVAI